MSATDKKRPASPAAESPRDTGRAPKGGSRSSSLVKVLDPNKMVGDQIRKYSNPAARKGLSKTNKALHAAERTKVMLESWQDEFNRCVALCSPGIKKVIELQQPDGVGRKNCVAYLLQDGSLFRTRSDQNRWPDGISPAQGPPLYGEVCRMWGNIRSASFAGDVGTLVTKDGDLIVVGHGDGTRKLRDRIKGSRVLLEACDVYGGALVAADDESFVLSVWDRKNASYFLNTALHAQPTHLVSLSTVGNDGKPKNATVLAIDNKLFSIGDREPLGAKWPLSTNLTELTKVTLTHQGDTIKDMVASSCYVAILSTMGEVQVFGRRVPWSSEPVPPLSTRCRLDLPEAESISCSRNFMAVVTKDGKLFTCGTETAPPRRPNPAHEFHEVPWPDYVRQAFCTELDGLTIVNKDGTVWHCRKKYGDPVQDVRWPHMGSCWYLVQNVLSSATRLDADSRCYAVLCWVRAVLGQHDARQQDALVEMMQWDVDHAVSGHSVAVHPVVFLRFFVNETPFKVKKKPWLTLWPQHLENVCRAIRSVHLAADRKADVVYWPGVEDEALRRYFDDVGCLEQVAVQQLLLDLPTDLKPAGASESSGSATVEQEQEQRLLCRLRIV